MTDVFISYKRTDLDKVLKIAEALQAKGLSVWYDARLEAGSSFDAEITKALREAKTVLVCWSKASCDSEWVRAEATEGRQKQKLISCMLENCEPYPPFNLIHHEDLSDWRGADDHVGWRRTLAAIGNRIERGDLGDASLRPRDARKSVNPAIWLGGATLAAMLVGGVGYWSVARGPSAPPTQAAAVSAPVEIAPAPEAQAPVVQAPVVEAPAAVTPASVERPAQADPAPTRPRGFVMVGDERTFGAALRFPVEVAFNREAAADARFGDAFFSRLVRRFQNAKMEGVDITAPQIRDDPEAEATRERRLAAIVDAFTSRGIPAKDIAITYEARDPSTYGLTLYYREKDARSVME